MKNELLKESLYIINTHVKTSKVDVELKVLDLKNKIQAELEKPDEPSASIFACYLFDNHEGSVISEELVIKWLGEMLSNTTYTSLPQQKPLSDDVIGEILASLDFKQMVTFDDIFYLLSRAIERAHRIGVDNG